MKKHLAKMRHGLIGALDIGTTKVCCWVGHLDENRHFKVIGMGHKASKGFAGGIVTDMAALEASIADAVSEAEKMSGETLQSVFMNVSGSYVTSTIKQVEISIPNQTVEEEDLKRLLLQARLEQDPDAVGTVHTIPLQYNLDGQLGIQDPRGMIGSRLKGVVHVMSAALGPLRNILMCVERCHLDISALVSSPYASGLSCLLDDERELGVTLVELGGGSTTIASFWGNALVYVDVIPIGSHHITNDLARGLETAVHYSERLKVLYGAAVASENDQREMVSVPQLGDLKEEFLQKIPRAVLMNMVRSRLEEIFYHVRRKLEASVFHKLLGQRVVLTGGGSQLTGIREFAAEALKKSVSLGKPLGFPNLPESGRPEFSTITGLLSYAQTEEFQRMQGFMGHHEKKKRTAWARATGWMRENL
ncbi:MAG: cell division protein FtsA [Alphaproteobacteria bacterium]